VTAESPAPMLVKIRGLQLLKKKRGSGKDSCDLRTCTSTSHEKWPNPTSSGVGWKRGVQQGEKQNKGWSFLLLRVHWKSVTRYAAGGRG
jgi:hypothetical protein